MLKCQTLNAKLVLRLFSYLYICIVYRTDQILLFLLCANCSMIPRTICITNLIYRLYVNMPQTNCTTSDKISMLRHKWERENTLIIVRTLPRDYGNRGFLISRWFISQTVKRFDIFEEHGSTIEVDVIVEGDLEWLSKRAILHKLLGNKTFSG